MEMMCSLTYNRMCTLIGHLDRPLPLRGKRSGRASVVRRRGSGQRWLEEADRGAKENRGFRAEGRALVERICLRRIDYESSDCWGDAGGRGDEHAA